MTEYISLASRLPLAAPMAIFLEFTNRCNFRCSFCPESLPDYADKAGGIHKLSWDLFRKICGDLKQMQGIKVLRFYGLGETLLHLSALSMITEACALDLAERTEMTSNGSMLSTSASTVLIHSGLNALHVSAYGTTADEMRSFTQSPIPPERIRENLWAFMDLRGKFRKPKLIVKITTEPEKIERFSAMFRDVCDELDIQPLHNWTGQDRLTTIGRPHQKAVCPSPFYIMKINSDGIVTCCATDWRRDTAVGNVADESLSAIWNGQRMKEFRLMHLNHRRCDNAACANCDFIDSFHDDLDSVSPGVMA